MSPHETGTRLAALINTFGHKAPIPLRSAIACLEVALENESHRHRLAYYLSCVQDQLRDDQHDLHARLDELQPVLREFDREAMVLVNRAYCEERAQQRPDPE